MKYVIARKGRFFTNLFACFHDDGRFEWVTGVDQATKFQGEDDAQRVFKELEPQWQLVAKIYRWTREKMAIAS